MATEPNEPRPKRKYTKRTTTAPKPDPAPAPEVLDDGWNRQTRISKRVLVVQRTSFQDGTWHPTEIFWTPIPGADVKGAKQFAEQLLQAAKLATRWNQERAGKMNEHYKKDGFK